MRVLVMGAGGVGGYYGALLAQRGHPVAFVARGAHLAAMRERGLEVRSLGQTTVVRPVTAVADPAEAAGPLDLVLFTVKGYDTEVAAGALRPVVGADTAVLTLQNGVESVERLGAVLAPERILAGSTVIATAVAAPGVIEHASPFRRITLGEPSGAVTPRVEQIAAALREAGAEVTVTREPRLAVWEKFVRLAPMASVTSACQAPIGEIRDTPEGAALYRALTAETVAVGRAAGVPLPADAVDAGAAIVRTFPAAMRTSMQLDYERRHRVELEDLTGAVVRLGRRLGVSTPSFDAVYAILKVRALAFGGLGPAHQRQATPDPASAGGGPRP